MGIKNSQRKRRTRHPRDISISFYQQESCRRGINSRDLSALIQDSQKINPDSSCSRRNKGLSKGYFHIVPSIDEARRENGRRRSKGGAPDNSKFSKFTKDNNFRKKLGEDPESISLDPNDNSKGRKDP